jgi:hypothetical protein
VKFKQYLEEKKLSEEFQDKIMLLIYLSENDNLNESYNLEILTESQKLELIEGVNDWLNKVGLKLHKGDGIIDYLIGFSKGAGQLIMAAIKKDEKKVKEIASKMSKEKVIDFLLKLDMATMHVVTGPIHFIDAVTGWDLMADLKGAAETAKDKLNAFYNAMKKVKDSIAVVLSGDKKQKMLKAASRIEYNMPDPK